MPWRNIEVYYGDCHNTLNFAGDVALANGTRRRSNIDSPYRSLDEYALHVITYKHFYHLTKFDSPSATTYFTRDFDMAYGTDGDYRRVYNQARNCFPFL